MNKKYPGVGEKLKILPFMNWGAIFYPPSSITNKVGGVEKSPQGTNEIDLMEKLEVKTRHR